MHTTLIILDKASDWKPYYETESTITAGEYLQNEQLSQERLLIINLCSDLSYNSEGYYCSLLAQARKHKVIPSVDAINSLDCDRTIKLQGLLKKTCHSWVCGSPTPHGDASACTLDIFFGDCEDPSLRRLAKFIFDQFPFPMLRATFSDSKFTQLEHFRTMALSELDDAQQTLFANAIDRFNKKIWRYPKSRKPFGYDLAILHDPKEKIPPSNLSALHLFVSEAKKMNINAELITADDSSRLMEFDALFIRQTTAVNHVTYQLAKKAQQGDMVVIDDPTSIIRCTNKVYLKELLDREKVPCPQSRLVFKTNPASYQELSQALGKTMVVKVPDGSFSIGVTRVTNQQEYEKTIAELFYRSSILLVQEFLPTDYDWRIGILGGECIYGCKYYMARGHWQIIQHRANGIPKEGGYQTIPLYDIPTKVRKLAVRATTLVGKGLYGVDIKVIDDQPMVIEINDNPSIEHGVEDKIMGNELYRIILREFVNRLNHKQHK
ncbi:MAG: RimK family protein [Desulforhopalus sp.]|nr:RimK family protein [Desulforhopalus sp.]